MSRRGGARISRGWAELERDAVATAPVIVDAFLEEIGRRNGALANVIFGFQTAISMRLFIHGPGRVQPAPCGRAFAFVPGRKAWRGADFSDLAHIIPDEERDALPARIDLLHRHPATQGPGFAGAVDLRFDGNRHVEDLVGLVLDSL